MIGKYIKARKFTPYPETIKTPNTARKTKIILTKALVTYAIGNTSRGK